MAKQLQLRRGTTAQHATFTGAVGEVTIDTDKDVVVVHDGATAGGFPSQKQLVSGTNIKTINDTSLLGSGNISIGVSSLSDTSISSPLSGQVLSYDGVNWANVTFSALDAYSKEDTDILLAAKQETLVSGTNIKTINSNNILGSGDISIPSLSGITAYHLLQGNLAIDNYVTTQGFNTTLYTGNGSTQSINTGIDMATQWGNDASETFGGLVWLKGRSSATGHNLLDSTRNNFDQVIYSHSTTSGVSANVIDVTNNGFSVNTTSDVNQNLVTYTSWNFQTTHRISGTTNHGKAYTCHYNPFTGFTMVKYEGSGLAGHEIPHHLGRKLGFSTFKSLTSPDSWGSVYYSNSIILNLNNTNAQTTFGGSVNENTFISNNTSSFENALSNTYILYGWANSYFDETNKLIGNYEVGIYQGTGASGNKVTTRGKPAWVMTKRLDSTSNWNIVDNQRWNTGSINLEANTADAEPSAGYEFRYTFQENGFTTVSDNVEYNSSGGQYLYMVAYDTNSNGGGSYYEKSTDNAQVQINNALIPLAKGIDSNGIKNEIVVANETITGITLTEGKNYIYRTDSGYGVDVHRPRYLASDMKREYAGESPKYYDVNTNKWYDCSAGSELVTNGTFETVADGIFGYDNGNGTVDGIVNDQVNILSSIFNNTLRVTNNTGVGAGIAFNISGLSIGKKYRHIITASPSISVNYINCRYSFDGGTTWIASASLTSAGTFDIGIIAQNTTIKVHLYSYAGGTNHYITYDNQTMFEADIEATTETTSRNYLNHIVHADSTGNPLYVEELPKIEYKDVVKANEYQGKNACTAWVNFDGTTTPPTIRDSYNVSSVVRTGTGVYDVYFTIPMDNTNYSCSTSSGSSVYDQSENFGSKSLNKIQVKGTNGSGFINLSIDLQIFGGKN